MLQGYILIEALCLEEQQPVPHFDFAQGGLFGEDTEMASARVTADPLGG
jgi:hypothetical protein